MEKYDGVIGQWLARGYNVLTYDVRGQGLSARAFALPIIGHVKSFGEYQLDIDAVLDVAMDLAWRFRRLCCVIPWAERLVCGRCIETRGLSG